MGLELRICCRGAEGALRSLRNWVDEDVGNEAKKPTVDEQIGK